MQNDWQGHGFALVNETTKIELYITLVVHKAGAQETSESSTIRRFINSRPPSHVKCEESPDQPELKKMGEADGS